MQSEHGYIIAERADGLRGATVWLDFPSVGATENILMAAVLAKGTTVIDNAAREPEIVDLCAMLTRWARGSTAPARRTLEIDGVDALHPVEPRDRARPDRRRHLGVRRRR